MPRQNCLYKGCREKDCDRYDHDPSFISLAISLERAVIMRATVQERDGGAFIDLLLLGGRMVRIGVSGNVHDEAYLVFESAEIPNPRKEEYDG